MTQIEALKAIDSISHETWVKLASLLTKDQDEALDMALCALHEDPCIYCSNYASCEPWKSENYDTAKKH